MSYLNGKFTVEVLSVQTKQQIWSSYLQDTNKQVSIEKLCFSILFIENKRNDQKKMYKCIKCYVPAKVTLLAI